MLNLLLLLNIIGCAVCELRTEKIDVVIDITKDYFLDTTFIITDNFSYYAEILEPIQMRLSSRGSPYLILLDDGDSPGVELEMKLKVMASQVRTSYIFFYQDLLLLKSRLHYYGRIIIENYIITLTDDEAMSYTFLSYTSEYHFPNAIAVSPSDRTEGLWFVKTADRIGPNIELITSGAWSPATGLNTYGELFPYKMGNFHGMDVKVVGLEYAPGFYRETVDGNVVEKGTDPFVLGLASKLWNINYIIGPPSEPEWGIWSEERQRYTGMVLDVFLGDAHAGIGSPIMSAGTYPACDFPGTILMDYVTLVTPTPDYEPKWMSLVRPFSNWSWYGLIVTFFIYAIIYGLINRYSTSLYQDKEEDGWPASILAVFKAQCFQPMYIINVAPYRTAERIAVAFWVYYCVIVFNIYRGVLVGYIMNPSMLPPIDNLDQMLEAEPTYYMYNYFGPELALYEVIPQMKVAWQEMNFANDDQHFVAYDSLGVTLEGNNVFFEFETYIDFVTNKLFTNSFGNAMLRKAKDIKFIYPFTILVSKGSPFGKKYAFIINQAFAGGLMKNHIDNIYYSFQVRKEGMISEPLVKPLTNEHYTGCWFLFAFGLIFGILSMLWEFSWAKYLKKCFSVKSAKKEID